VFDNIEKKKQLLLADLRPLTGLEKERGLVEKEITRKVAMITELKMIPLWEEVSWRQKSSALWLREGDKCIVFSLSSQFE
jgi:hypothetical protein